MQKTNPEIDIILYDNKFGCITNAKVILYNKELKDNIEFNSISKIRLVKKRTFYINTLIFTISIILIYFCYNLFQNHPLTSSLFLLIGVSFLIFSFLYKFHIYKMIIKENDNKIHEIKTTQLRKKDIKKLYNYIANKIKKSKD